MTRVLYVVHRYVPYPGGSEFFTRDMAEESLKRGWDVTVLAHEHQGDQNGVKVTSDYQVLAEAWNLIVVHGADCISQNIVHQNAFRIRAPVLYMIIKPSESPFALHGMKHHDFLAYSTSMDIEHITKHGYLHKARRVRHGIVPDRTIVPKALTNWSSKQTFVSAGGFYPHKAMVPLAKAFEASEVEGELHLYGYADGPKPENTDRVKVFLGQSKEEVMKAIAYADAYIMNSYEEGFGLVLLEAMMNRTPWFARNIAGAADMAQYGHVYETEEMLMRLLQYSEPREIDRKIEAGYNYVMSNHTITETVNDIEDVIRETL